MCGSPLALVLGRQASEEKLNGLETQPAPMERIVGWLHALPDSCPVQKRTSQELGLISVRAGVP